MGEFRYLRQRGEDDMLGCNCRLQEATVSCNFWYAPLLERLVCNLVQRLWVLARSGPPADKLGDGL